MVSQFGAHVPDHMVTNEQMLYLCVFADHPRGGNPGSSPLHPNGLPTCPASADQRMLEGEPKSKADQRGGVLLRQTSEQTMSDTQAVEFAIHCTTISPTSGDHGTTQVMTRLNEILHQEIERRSHQVRA
jgi:hypothetical protein